METIDFCRTFISTLPVNSVKKDSNSKEFSWSWRSNSSESLHSGSSELRSHELPEFSCWLVPDPLPASYETFYFMKEFSKESNYGGMEHSIFEKRDSHLL